MSQALGRNVERLLPGGRLKTQAFEFSDSTREMQSGLVAGDYLQADETPIRYFDPDVRGKSQQGY